MLFRAVQNGLCTMAEKKSSPEKNEVPAHCPTCPPVSGVERAEWGRGDGTIDKDPAKELSPEALLLLCSGKPGTWDRPTVSSSASYCSASSYSASSCSASSWALDFSSTCSSRAAIASLLHCPQCLLRAHLESGASAVEPEWSAVISNPEVTMLASQKRWED